jgi:hypothetical protein
MTLNSVSTWSSLSVARLDKAASYSACQHYQVIPPYQVRNPSPPPKSQSAPPGRDPPYPVAIFHIQTLLPSLLRVLCVSVVKSLSVISRTISAPSKVEICYSTRESFQGITLAGRAR